MAGKSVATVGDGVARERADIVGQSIFLDLSLTVPGGAVLLAAGVSYVAVAPTHRRRGILRSMYTELHQRIADAQYPIAALTASEGGIYGRFGYGPATTVQLMTIDRRFAQFHASVPDPGGVRLVKPAEHRDAFAEIYDRWRLQTPGGLAATTALWDEVLADREDTRDGGSPWFAFLHPAGYALYRVHGEESRSLHLDVLGSLYLGAHRPEAFVVANRLRGRDSGVVRALSTAFGGDVAAELGYGF